jgi:hypothetical protein
VPGQFSVVDRFVNFSTDFEKSVKVLVFGDPDTPGRKKWSINKFNSILVFGVPYADFQVFSYF